MAYSIIKKNCDGCSACFRKCPARAIKGEFLETYSIDEKLCIRCGLCGMICPKEAVLDSEGKLCERVPREERALPEVDQDICTACEKCVAICPFQCREISGNRPFEGISNMAREGYCVSCGECEKTCRKGAIIMKKNIRTMT